MNKYDDGFLHDGYDHLFEDGYEKKYPVRFPDNPTLTYKIFDSSNTTQQPMFKTNCPKCNEEVDAIIINEYAEYAELYHDAFFCKAEWSYSTYQQCKDLQEAKEKLLLMSREVSNTEGMGPALGVLTLGVYSTLIALGPIGWVAGGIGSYIVREGVKSKVINDKKKEALRDSYDIGSFFKNLKNHYLDPEFIKEQEPYLEEIEKWNKSLASHSSEFNDSTDAINHVW